MGSNKQHMEKEAKTEAERKVTGEPSEAHSEPGVSAQEPARSSLPEQGRDQPAPAAPAWTDEATFEIVEQPLQAGETAPDVTDFSAGGTALEPLRKYAPWVTLALFLLFPTYFTLGLLGLALALHTARFLQIVRGLRLEHWGYVAITLLGTGLRFWDLGLKPLHHDESMHAYFSWQLFLDPASYQYNPLLHGPFQFHAIAYVYYVASHLGVADGGVNDVTARTAAAMLGSAMIPLCYWLRGRLGTLGGLAAAFLLAVSPMFVYYSRFTREDIYFASFTLATVGAFFKFCEARRLRWLLVCVAACVLAYATKEAAFFNMAMFGGILGAFAAWELGVRYVYPSARRRMEGAAAQAEEASPAGGRGWALGLRRHAGVPAVLLYLLVGGMLARVVLGKVAQLSAYLSAVDLNNSPNQTQVANSRLMQATATVQQIEDTLVNGLLIVLVLVAVVVLGVVIWQLFHDPYEEALSVPRPPRGLARWVDAERQPLLAGLVRMPWTFWFFALLVAFTIFAGLFWIVPAVGSPACANSSTPPSYALQYTYSGGTVYAGPSGTVCTWSQGFHAGIGDGLVQGIFYWITQQQVARGGQPWYYYLLLIPLYEQLIVVFGIGGLIRCLARPNRFRVCVACWFVASLFLYSWAGEKMPWLGLHILLPLLLLAALALEGALAKLVGLLEELARNRQTTGSVFGVRQRLVAGAGGGWLSLTAGAVLVVVPPGWVWRRYGGALLSLVGAFVLLVPMLHSMLYVTYVDPGSAPNEMLAYVQTTTDVTLVLGKIEALDQDLYHGQHLLKIGVDGANDWPFRWYLRDYTNVSWEYDGQHPAPQDLDVLILAPGAYSQLYAPPDQIYQAKEYRLRAWWDEGYKPQPPCNLGTAGCSYNPNTLLYGDGLGEWLSYGDNPPPPGKSFDLGKAVSHLWQWLWTRQPIGSANGSTDFMFLVRTGLPMTP